MSMEIVFHSPLSYGLMCVRNRIICFSLQWDSPIAPVVACESTHQHLAELHYVTCFAATKLLFYEV